MKRFLIDDKANEPLTKTLVIRMSQKDYNRIKLNAFTFAKGKVSRYVRAAAKFFVPKKEHLIEEEFSDESEQKRILSSRRRKLRYGRVHKRPSNVDMG